MKKFILPVAFCSLVLFFAACKKDTPTTTSTLTILKGEVFANLDYTNDTIGNLTPFFKEHAKAGTVITVLVNPNDLQSNPDTSKKYDDYRNFKNSEFLHTHGFYIGIYPSLKNKQIDVLKKI